MAKSKITTAGQTRVWLVENGVGPHREPAFMGTMAIGDSDWPAGDITPVKIPDPDHFNRFITAGHIRGAEENLTLTINARYPEQASVLLDLRRKMCRSDLHVPLGKCTNPQIYNRWEKMRVYRLGQITSWGDENAGALDDDEQDVINENGEFSFEELYELVDLTLQEVASTTVVREIVDVSVCDQQNCGECEGEGDGVSKFFGTMLGSGATPGTLPSVIYTEDGGKTWAATDIDTAFSNETPTDGECVRDFYVVTMKESNSVHFANKEDILNGTETWYETTTGFVVGNGPNAIFALSGMDVWIVGDNGYVYRATDIETEVEVSHAGIATTQDLLSVHASDSEHILAVGELNAVIFSANAGETWQVIAGPAAGESIRTCWMLDQDTWLVATNTGTHYYTNDAGDNWTEKSLPSGVDNVDKIQFFDDTVGYMAVRKGTKGFILRTTNGGYSWGEMPQNGSAIAANDYLNDIAVSPFEPNLVVAGGLADDATDGFVVVGN